MVLAIFSKKTRTIKSCIYLSSFYSLIMPEIWLNYGKNEVVLDIMAENLDERIEFEKPVIDDSVINENLEGLDLSKPTEIVIQNYSESIQKTLDKIYEKCEIKSFSKPKLSVDKRNLPQVKANNPDTVSINEFEEQELSNSNLVFIGEAQFDGLFGYETVATRLLRKFGADKMIEAFSHRSGNTPNSGTDSPSMNDAKSFTDGFEVSCIEITANKKGISGLQVGHPSKTSSVAKELEKSTATFEEKFRTMIISTGRDASNQTLSSSLNSIWNFYTSIKNQGLIILVAECMAGLGSETFQKLIDGRITPERIKNASKYEDGMENLLFLSEIQKNCQIAITSILPELYIKKLGMIPVDGIKKSMDYILKNQGPRQKVQVIEDGARTLLREN